eukprot:TRINITY_DN21657_c0_g1_i1.p2 TRINITY_DN21657_c0_g1~~TRINITY_DN21657_c0_g1_i1.p2  ORF type:complete len:104 (+),score=6.16 TRINITY_DN21657_c0_g1_i1:152-463(+)
MVETSTFENVHRRPVQSRHATGNLFANQVDSSFRWQNLQCLPLPCMGVETIKRPFLGEPAASPMQSIPHPCVVFRNTMVPLHPDICDIVTYFIDWWGGEHCYV